MLTAHIPLPNCSAEGLYPVPLHGSTWGFRYYRDYGRERVDLNATFETHEIMAATDELRERIRVAEALQC